jgi:HD-like signal output (HDOD) protein
MTRRVLFVDDEPAILAALRNLLHRDRRRWEMVFAPSGEAALEELSRARFDVVVSDMRMPGIDGATLLTRIQRDYPATVRIMLSGHADHEAIVRALPALHQLLSKPCDVKTLRGAIERAMDLEALAHDAAIREVICKLDKLPSPPDVYLDLTRALASSTSTITDVARIVARDPGICAKLLQLVNSAYFGHGGATSSIEHAIAQLGTEQLRYVALTASVFASLDTRGFTAFSIDDFQESSARVSRIARQLAPRDKSTEAFVAGLLHDVGQLVLAIGMRETYAEVVRRTRAGENVLAVERELIGASHADIGAGLLRIWGVPPSIVEPIRFHHDPTQAPEDAREIAMAIQVAHATEKRPSPRLSQEILDRTVYDRIGLGDRFTDWCAIAGQVS